MVREVADVAQKMPPERLSFYSSVGVLQAPMLRQRCIRPSPTSGTEAVWSIQRELLRPDDCCFRIMLCFSEESFVQYAETCSHPFVCVLYKNG